MKTVGSIGHPVLFSMHELRVTDRSLFSVDAQHGFTLVELLVVVAIIGILASLLFPVLTRVKQRSRETICLNNLRQIGIAIRLYHDGNNSKLPLRMSMRGSPGMPPSGSSFDSSTIWDFTHALGGRDGMPGARVPPAAQRPLFPYAGNAELFHCHADRGWNDERRNQSVLPSYWSVSGCSYTYNALGPVQSVPELAETGVANKTDTAFPQPTTLVLMYERPAALWGSESPIILWHRAKNSQALFLNEHYASGRELVAPFLFMDGHVQMLIFKAGESPATSARISWK